MCAHALIVGINNKSVQILTQLVEKLWEGDERKNTIEHKFCVFSYALKMFERLQAYHKLSIARYQVSFYANNFFE